MKNTKVLLFSLAALVSGGTLKAQAVQNWKTGGNALTVAGKLGTTTLQDVNFISNNVLNGTLTKGGRWGFGLTLPSAKVQINSAVGEDAFRVQVGGNTKLVLAANGGLTVGANVITPPALGLFVQGSTGIGTTVPKTKAHIFNAGSGATPTLNTVLTVENSTHSYISLLAPEPAETGIIFGHNLNAVSGGIFYNNPFGPDSKNGFQFRTNGNVTKMTLTNDGQLNIGSAAGPSVYRLRVDQNSGFGLDIANTTSDVSDWELFSSGNLLFFGNGFFKGSFSQADGTYSSVSDERLKTDIKPMPSILEKILQLKPVSYRFKNTENKQQQDGFIAQDVMKVFPSVVTHNVSKERNLDVYTLNYSGFGTIAIKGIQELVKMSEAKDAEIDNLQKQIDELKAIVLKGSQRSVSSQAPANVSLAVASLEQNAPNPFSSTTAIRYTLPQKFTTAQIIVTDKNGNTIKQVNVSGAGNGVVNIEAASLSSGTYNYALVVDGKMAGTKQMVIAR